MKLILICFLAFIGYWRDEKLLHIITGLTWMIYGGYYIATAEYIGIAVVLFGGFTFYRGLFLRHK